MALRRADRHGRARRRVLGLRARRGVDAGGGGGGVALRRRRRARFARERRGAPVAARVGEREAEHGVAGLALDRDLAFVELEDALRDRKPEPRVAFGEAAAFLDAIE